MSVCVSVCVCVCMCIYVYRQKCGIMAGAGHVLEIKCINLTDASVCLIKCINLTHASVCFILLCDR